jgi:hypothetical protein
MCTGLVFAKDVTFNMNARLCMYVCVCVCVRACACVRAYEWNGTEV